MENKTIGGDTLIEVKDKQRVAFEKLLTTAIPELLQNSSYKFANRFEVTFSMYPADMNNVIDDNGTHYLMIKAICSIKDLQTGESQDCIIDLLKLPVFEELGFKIGGNYKQVLDLYERPLGWTFSYKSTNNGVEYFADLRSANFKKIQFYCKDKEPSFYHSRSNKTDNRDDIVKISISSFFRALTGLTSSELLEVFGDDNAYNVMTFGKDTGKHIETSYTKTKHKISSRADCIRVLHTVLFGLDKTMEANHTLVQLRNIEKWFFDKNYLNLGKANTDRFNVTQSFLKRAINKKLAKSVQLVNEVIPADTALTFDILQKIDASPVNIIYVQHNGKVHSLRKFTSFTFQALGLTLAEPITLDDVTLNAGTVLDLEKLNILNASKLDCIKVFENNGLKGRKIINVTRRVDASTLTIEDLYTAYSIFANNLNGYDFYSNTYELTDRVIVPFDKKALNLLVGYMSVIISNLNEKFKLMENSYSESADNILNSLSDYSNKIDKDALIALVQKVDSSEAQMSDYNNLVSFVAKDFKVTNSIKSDQVSPELVSVQATQFGRLDPYDSPESQKIGLVHERTLLTKETEAGYLTTPYYVVENGVVTDKVVELDANADRDAYIAEWCETFMNEDGTPKQRVNARHNGEIITTDVKSVKYKEYSQLQNLALTTGLIPFSNFAAGKRIQMSDNQSKQAVPTCGSERAVVDTGVGSLLDIGTYRAETVLQSYYQELLYMIPEVENYKSTIMKSNLVLDSIIEAENTRTLKFRVAAYNELMALLNINNNSLTDMITLAIPFGRKTMNDDMFSYRIVPKVDNVYKCTDIIAYSTDYDINEYSMDKLVDYGGIQASDEQLKTGLAVGHNYFVGFKTFEGSSIDDGIVINRKLVYDDTLTSIYIKSIKSEINSNMGTSVKFEKPSYADSRYGENGLPLLGTQLEPGDVAIYKKRVASSGNNKNKVYFETETLNSFTEGQVIKSDIYTDVTGKTVAEVQIASRASAEVGDKLAGRHGNKGVIARIVDNEDMPYDPVTGRSLDILLNPQGIPSRMNISQLLDTALGAAEMASGHIAIVSPFHPDSRKFVEQRCEEFNIKPIMLIDGRTGEYFERPVNVGYQYMQKLVHMVRKKVHSVGFSHGVHPITLQAKSSSKLNGGQSIGEMESWCLECVDAPHVLQEIQTVLADDRLARKRVLTGILTDPYDVHEEGENYNFNTFQAMLRPLGTEISNASEVSGGKQIDYYQFAPLTDEVTRTFSSTPVMNDSLRAANIFGDNTSLSGKTLNRTRWGYIELNTTIVHPSWLEKGSIANIFIKKTSESKSIQYCTNTDLAKIRDGQSYVYTAAYSLSQLNILSAKEYEELDDADKLQYMTGLKALTYVFQHYDVEASLSLLKSRYLESSSMSNKKLGDEKKDIVLSAKQMQEYIRTGTFTKDESTDETVDSNKKEYDPEDISSIYKYVYDSNSKMNILDRVNFITDFIERGDKLSNYLISTYPVLPAIFRPTDNMSRTGKERPSDFDIHYQNILAAAQAVNENDNEINQMKVYTAIKDFIGFGAENRKTKFTNVLQWFTGKGEKNHGKIRETVQKKVVARSGRTIIIPTQNITWSPSFLGIPLCMAVNVWEDQLIPHLLKYRIDSTTAIRPQMVKDLMVAIAAQSKEKFEKLYLDHFMSSYGLSVYDAYNQFYLWIKAFIEGTNVSGICGANGETITPQVVIAGRQPSLHKYSIRAFYPKIVKTKTMQIHPLVCNGYNADFDGDQMWFCALLSEEAKAEAIDKLSVMKDIINAKNGDVILKHSQDIALGIYCATMLKDNALCIADYDVPNYDINYYSSILELRADVLERIIHTYELVCLDYEGNKYVSTAGRILFNSLLPGGLSPDNKFTNPLQIPGLMEDHYSGLLYDGLITSGSPNAHIDSFKLSSICKKIYEESLSTDTYALIDVYQDITEMGFRICDLFGVSISLDDLKEITDRSTKSEKLKDADEEKAAYERDYQFGLLSLDDKVTAVHKVYKHTLDSIQDNIFGNDTKNILSSMNRNNNVFIMYDSGARGSKLQIMQTVGAVGSLQKTKTEDLPNPITSNYSEGLSSFDFQMMAYSTRTGMASTQNETANAGYGTRKAVYCTAGIKIIEADCGKTDWWYDIEYDSTKPLNHLSMLKPNKEYFDRTLLGKSVKDKETLQLLGDTIDKEGKITEKSYDILKNGFHSLIIQNDKSQDLIEISLESLVGREPVDDYSKKLLKNFLKFGLITSEGIAILKRRCVKHVETDIGTFEFRYGMSKLSKSLLQNREGRNLPYLRKYIGPNSEILNSSMQIITSKTISAIEEQGLERIEARILLDCKTGRDNSKHIGSINGCCARCYGLKYSSNTLPKVGENIGIEAAQAIGEPAAQLTLSLVNKGGAAGETVASGVDILHKLLSGTPITVSGDAQIMRKSGYLMLEKIKNDTIMQLESKDGILMSDEALTGTKKAVKLKTNQLICTNGEWVNAGEPITIGYIQPNMIWSTPESDNKNLIRKKQVAWLDNWYKNFDDNNISINARHFEIFTRAQLSDVKIIKSDDPDYKVGRHYKYSEVADNENVAFIAELNRLSDTIIENSGALASLSFEQVVKSAVDLTTSGYKSYENSAIGALNLGENLLNAGEKKQLYKPPKFMQSNTEKSVLPETNFTISEEKSEINNTLNFDDLNSLDLQDFSYLNIDSDEAISSTDEDVISAESSPNKDSLLHLGLFDTESKESLETSSSEKAIMDSIESPVTSEVKTHNIFKSIWSDDFKPLEGFEVLLLKGTEIIAKQIVNESGEVVFTDVNSGVYSLVIKDDRLEHDYREIVKINPDESLIRLDTSYVSLKANDSSTTIFANETDYIDNEEYSEYEDSFDDLDLF